MIMMLESDFLSLFPLLDKNVHIIPLIPCLLFSYLHALYTSGR